MNPRRLNHRKILLFQEVVSVVKLSFALSFSLINLINQSTYISNVCDDEMFSLRESHEKKNDVATF